MACGPCLVGNTTGRVSCRCMRLHQSTPNGARSLFELPSRSIHRPLAGAVLQDLSHVVKTPQRTRGAVDAIFRAEIGWVWCAWRCGRDHGNGWPEKKVVVLGENVHEQQTDLVPAMDVDDGQEWQCARILQHLVQLTDVIHATVEE